jgi:hypothetical protein
MKHLFTGPLLLIAVFASACSEQPGTTEVAAAGGVSAVTTISVVMSNLNSPRGLGFGPEGALYVAESGSATINGPCIPFMEGPMLATRCYSGTGAVSRWWKGRQERVVSGLPSSVIVESGAAAGPQDISFQGRGNAYVPIGLGGIPALRPDLGPHGPLLGTLIRITPNGAWSVVADIAAFEGAHNPAGGMIDSNPYGVLAEGGRNFVVDAGGNSLLQVDAKGQVSLVAVFPSTPAPPPFNQADAVPTKIERGPDGSLFVSTLTGLPFVDGAAGIYRIVPGQAPQLVEGGFKMITDFAVGPDGSLWVVQFVTTGFPPIGPGSLVRVAPDGTRTVVLADLMQPTGVAVGRDGSVYVSNGGTSSGMGEVLKIQFQD